MFLPFKTIFNYILSLFTSPKVIVNEPQTKRHYDTTKFTPDMVEYIRQRHGEERNCTNPEYRITMDTLSKELNAHFGLSKSQTSYANVWNHTGAYAPPTDSE